MGRSDYRVIGDARRRSIATSLGNLSQASSFALLGNTVQRQLSRLRSRAKIPQSSDDDSTLNSYAGDLVQTMSQLYDVSLRIDDLTQSENLEGATLINDGDKGLKLEDLVGVKNDREPPRFLTGKVFM